MILLIRFRYIVLIAILAVLAGLAIYFLTNKKEALKFVVPELTKVTLIKVDIHEDTAFVDVYAIAENSSPYKMSIDSIIYDLSIGGVEIISERQYIGLSQERGQKDTVKLSVKIPVKHTMKTIQGLQSMDYTGFTLDATVVYNTVAGVKRLSISKGKDIEVPIPPQLKVVTEQKDLRLLQKEVDVDLFLHIVNEGKNIDLTLSGLQYELIIGKDLDTKGKLGKKVTVKPQSTTIVKFPLEFDLNRPLRTILRIWTDTDRVPYKLKLSGFIDSDKIKHIPIVVFSTGKLEIVNEDKKAKQKEQEKIREKAEKEKQREQKKTERGKK